MSPAGLEPALRWGAAGCAPEACALAGIRRPSPCPHTAVSLCASVSTRTPVTPDQGARATSAYVPAFHTLCLNQPHWEVLRATAQHMNFGGRSEPQHLGTGFLQPAGHSWGMD